MNSPRKPQLPPRRWHSLEQAIKRIKQLTGEELEIADLIHYAAVEKLLLSVYFIYYPARIAIGNLEIIDRSLFNQQLLFNNEKNFEIDYIFSISDKPKTFFQNEFVKKTLTPLEDFSYHDFWISGLMNLYSGIGHAPQDINEVLEKGVRLSNENIFVSPKYKIDNRVISIFSLITEQEFFLTIDNLFILDSDLNNFLFSETERVNISEALDKSKVGRKEADIKPLILSIAEATFKRHPNHSRNKITTAIHQYIEKYYSEEYLIPDKRTVVNYLKEANIGKIGATNKERVIIIDPYKQD